MSNPPRPFGCNLPLAVALLGVVFAGEARGAQLRAVQTGTTTLPGGSASVTATLSPAVDGTKAFLVFGVSESTSNPGDGQVTGQITNCTPTCDTVAFARSGTTGAITVKWYVAEFASGVSVQRGSVSLPPGPPSDTDVPIASVNLARSFPLVTLRTAGGLYDSGDFLRAKLTSSTNLRIFDPEGGAGLPVAEWQVVEYTDASVQTGDLSLTFSQTSQNATLAPAVNPSKSWLIFGYECTPAPCQSDQPNIGAKLFRGRITNSTTLTFDRSNASAAPAEIFNLTWYLVEFTDNTRVLNGSEPFAAAEGQRNVVIPPVTRDQSIAAGGGYARGGASPYNLDDNAGVAWFTLDVRSPRDLRLSRGATPAGANLGWYVIEFLTTRYRSIGTAGAYNTGSVTANNGSEVVMGSGTSWKTANRGRGDRITIPCPDPPTCTGGTNYTIFSVDSPTQLILTSVFTGTSGLQSYNITRKFATLQAWEDCVSGAALGPLCEGVTGGSLLADQRREVGIAYKETTFALSADVIIDGSITDSIHTITLTADPGNRHNGVPGAGVIVDGQSAPNNLQVRDDNVTIEWLEFIRVRGQNFVGAVQIGANPNPGPTNILVQNLLIHDFFDPGFDVRGIPLQGTGSKTVTIRNSMIWDGDFRGIEADDVTDLLTVENCTIDNMAEPVNGVGIHNNNSTVTVKNTIATSNAGGGFVAAGGSFSAASSNNTSSDATAPGASAQTGVAAAALFVAPNSNLHLKAGANVAVDTALDLSASFFIDIDNQIRAGLTWDRGADERDGTTAVELMSFEAQGVDRAVDLSWRTASELQNLGFHLHRSLSAEGPWERITSSLIPGLGSSPTGASYSYRDLGLANGMTYFYLLEDVETTGRMERHGPVSATPQAGSGGGGPGNAGSGEDGGSGGGSGGSGRITYGDPSGASLRVVERGSSYVVLELLTPGFTASTETDGTVRISIPGFEDTASPGALAVPVRHALVEALAGRKAFLTSVTPEDVVRFDGFRLAAAGTREVVVTDQGVVKPGSSPRHLREPFRRGGFAPRLWARLLGSVFQGETKKVRLELSPLRHDPVSGRTVLARRLLVRVEFSGIEAGEKSLGGSRGQKLPGAPTLRTRGVVAQLAAHDSGLYRVRFEDVFGTARRGVNARSLRLSRLGLPVAYHLEPDRALFGPGSSLFFVSPDSPSLHDRGEAVYELSLGQTAFRMTTLSASPSGPLTTEYVKTLHLEENHFYQSALLQAPDLWLWDLLVSPVTKTYPFTLDALSASSTSSHLKVVLQGASDFEELDHHVRLFVNGIPVGEATWDGKVEQVIEADLNAGILVEGSNSLSIENLGDAGAAYSMVFLNRFEVSYPRLLTTTTGNLEGHFDQSGRAEVLGLTANAFVVETTSTPVWLKATEATLLGHAFHADAERSYLAVSETALLTPEVRVGVPSGLKTTATRADWILIGPKEFLSVAKPLVNLRRRQGLLTKTVALEDVYSEFGFGEPSPKAIHDFLAFAFHNWKKKPRYVVLLGDSTYDPKDYLQTHVKDRIPSPIVETSYLWTVSDPSLAAINGEDLIPDLAIGRLSAGTLEEAQRLVTKLVAFEQAGRTLDGKAVLVADNADLAGNFEQDQDEIASSILHDREVEKVYLRDLGGATRTTIKAAFDSGPGLVCYVGHGATAVWASENVWNNTDIATLASQDQQPLLLTLNCLNGFFHFPPFDSLAEAFVKAEGKGAIAAFAPSGLSVNDAAHLYHKALLQEIESGAHPRLGDALLAAQKSYADQGAFPELLSIYHLFGDPAMRIR